MLEAELKQLIVDQGGIRPGVARREAFKDSPPSADMTYLKPWAESVVSFAMTTGTDWIEDYFGKVERMTMRDNTYHIYHNIYGVAESAAEHLKLAGYKAHAVIPNGLYRPDHTFEKELPDDPAKLPELFARLRADPANAAATKNLTFGTRGVLDRPKENIKTTCNHCITVCSGPMKRRKELRNLLFRSGVVELDDNGQEVVIKSH